GTFHVIKFRARFPPSPAGTSPVLRLVRKSFYRRLNYPVIAKKKDGAAGGSPTHFIRLARSEPCRHGPAASLALNCQKFSLFGVILHPQERFPQRGRRLRGRPRGSC